MSRPQQVVVIQYMRGVAAVLVVIYHVMTMAAVQARFAYPIGDCGVDIFFVISGFVMWTAAGDRGILSFWAARIWRIVPLCWLITSVYIVGALLFPGAMIYDHDFSPTYVLKSYLFIPAIDPVRGTILPVYAVLWTLDYEMFFYLVFGLTLLLSSKAIRLACLIAALVLLVAAGAAVSPAQPVLYYYTRHFLLEFLAGVITGVFAPRLMTARVSGSILFVLGALVLVAVQAFPDNTDARFWVTACASSALVAGSLSFEELARRRPLRLLHVIGDASYSMYLVHPLFQRAIYLAILATVGVQGPLRLAIYVAITSVGGTFGGIATFYLVERPILNLRKLRASRPVPREASA